MPSVRLYESQIRYLRERAGCWTLRTALTRYRNGELVTEKADFQLKPEKLLPYSLDKKIIGYTGSQVRAILFAAMRNPVNHASEIQTIGDEIDAFFDSFANTPFILKQEN